MQKGFEVRSCRREKSELWKSPHVLDLSTNFARAKFMARASLPAICRFAFGSIDQGEQLRSSHQFDRLPLELPKLQFVMSATLNSIVLVSDTSGLTMRVRL